MGFLIGELYTRDKIHDVLGGGKQICLPHKDNQVVCGAFRRKLNPDAPNVILPGHGRDIEKWAKVFSEQQYPIPIFRKQSTNNWEYVGNYQVRKYSTDPDEIRKYGRIAERDISMVLYLEKG